MMMKPYIIQQIANPHLKRKGSTKREDKTPTKGQHSKSQINQWNPKIKQHELMKKKLILKKNLNGFGSTPKLGIWFLVLLFKNQIMVLIYF
jgi:hypothetical protein